MLDLKKYQNLTEVEEERIVAELCEKLGRIEGIHEEGEENYNWCYNCPYDTYVGYFAEIMDEDPLNEVVLFYMPTIGECACSYDADEFPTYFDLIAHLEEAILKLLV